MIYSNRLLPGYIFTIFKRGEMIRLIIHRCFVFIENKNIIGKAFLPKIVHDFQVDEITRPSLEMLERLGEHMTWGVHRAQPGYYRFPEILFRKRKYSKLGDPFFWDRERPGGEDDGFRPAHALMFSFGVSPRNKMTFLISTVTKCGIDYDKELWQEDDIIYEMEGTDDYGAERMEYFIENHMTLSRFIMDYVNKNIDKLEVQY